MVALSRKLIKIEEKKLLTTRFSHHAHQTVILIAKSASVGRNIVIDVRIVDTAVEAIRHEFKLFIPFKSLKF